MQLRCQQKTLKPNELSSQDRRRVGTSDTRMGQGVPTGARRSMLESPFARGPGGADLPGLLS